MERQDEEDEGIRNVLLGMQENEHGMANLVLSADDQHQDGESFSNLQPTEEDTEPLQYQQDVYEEVHDMPILVEDDDVRMSDGSGNTEGPGGLVPVTAAARTTSSGTGPKNNATGNTTAIAKIPPSFPWHNTTEAVLEHHGSVAWTGLTKTAPGTSTYLKIRMNTYVEPYSNSSGTIGGTGTGDWEGIRANLFYNMSNINL